MAAVLPHPVKDIDSTDIYSKKKKNFKIFTLRFWGIWLFLCSDFVWIQFLLHPDSSTPLCDFIFVCLLVPWTWPWMTSLCILILCWCWLLIDWTHLPHNVYRSLRWFVAFCPDVKRVETSNHRFGTKQTSELIFRLWMSEPPNEKVWRMNPVFVLH